MGVMPLTVGMSTLEELAAADRGTYRAKGAGKKRVSVARKP